MIRFPNINLRLHSVHAANESWEGLNLLAWVMDEASAFRAAGGMTDISGAVYGTLRTSAHSRFPSLRWIGMIISFPRKQVGDFTLEKYKDAQTSPTMFGDRGATWDVNPQYDPAHPLFKDFPWVTIEALNIRIPKPFVEEFLKDPTDCKTKYMCEPPPQIGGFFELPTKLDECVDRELPGVVATSQLVKRTVRELDFEYVSMLIDQIPPRQEGCSYFLHGDPGLVSDAFSICVCHTLPESKWVVDLEGEERQLQKVVVDFVLNWERTSTTPVDLKNVEETIEKLARYYGIQRITFDRWNSATSIQSLIEKGFFAEDLSFSAAQQLQMQRNLKLDEAPAEASLVSELSRAASPDSASSAVWPVHRDRPRSARVSPNVAASYIFATRERADPPQRPSPKPSPGWQNAVLGSFATGPNPPPIAL